MRLSFASGHASAGQNRVRQFERDARAAEVRVRIVAIFAVRIDDGERGRKFGFGQVMVGHDHVDAEFVGARDGRSRANAVVDADDQPDSARRGLFHRRGLHSVAVVQAMRNVPARFRAGQFQRLFQNDCGGDSVDVVVAVDLDLLAARMARRMRSTARSMSRSRKGSCRSAMRGFRKRSAAAASRNPRR